MRGCEQRSKSKPPGSHVYVEKGAGDTRVGRRILSRLPGATVVPVRRYKDVFNRRGQDRLVQKSRMSLILAVKRPPFLYPVSDNCQRLGEGASMYTTPALNCPYDCAYCFLCGVYPSAYPVLFTNVEDFFDSTALAAQRAVQKGERLSLHLSYESDLFAFEKWTGLSAAWMAFVARTPGLTAELRTKSSGYPFEGGDTASERFVFAWSVSPQEMVRKYERRTPSLDARIRAAQRAVSDGHPVRFCVDPVIAVPAGAAAYQRMFKQVFSTIRPSAVRDVTVGPFRAGAGHLRTMKRLRPGSDLFAAGAAEENERLSRAVAEMAAGYVGKEKVVQWPSLS